MLTLPIKQPWFGMILSGKKTEEYRKICPYWTKRLETVYKMPMQDIIGSGAQAWVAFRNGYAEHAPRFNALVRLRIGTGKPEWGAEPGEEYLILQICGIYTFGMEGG